jgi:hypothetical protein
LFFSFSFSFFFFFFFAYMCIFLRTVFVASGVDVWVPVWAAYCVSLFLLVSRLGLGRDCSYQTDRGDDDPFGEEGSLWSFNFMFYARRQKRILYFSARGCSKRREDSDEASSHGYYGADPYPSDSEEQLGGGSQFTMDL